MRWNRRGLRERQGRTYDAIGAAAAREMTANETGRRRDRFRFVLSLGRVARSIGQEERYTNRVMRRSRRRRRDGEQPRRRRRIW
jgi:hypothetical protein